MKTVELPEFCPAVSLGNEEFEALRGLIYTRFGICLTDEKRSLLAGRLQKTVRRLKFSSFSEYYNYLKQDRSGRALEELATCVSTNHTFFYRESAHFEFFLNTALPQAVERSHRLHKRDLRIWSAGCSSGAEPYTLVMLMQEFLGAEYSRWSAGVLATDISSAALNAAKEGVYTEERLERLPQHLKSKFFKQIGPDQWAIAERVKKEVTFRTLNLMNKHFPFRDKFDLILCRNVMIYFDQETRNQLIDRFSEWIKPCGYLFIGHSELLESSRCALEYVMPAVYRKGEQ